jgi:O-antigen/teichoic acid export membrane protein
MLAEKVQAAPVAADAHRASFFRQSGWLMIANIAGGVLMWAVHFLAHVTGPNEYGIFVALLGVLICVPNMPLQMVLAQQTAKALATQRQGELSGLIRLLWLGTFLLWLAAAAAAVLLEPKILSHWKIANPAVLWMTLVAVLFSLWLPMFSGMLQGQQNFLWLGWTAMINGIGRVVIAAVAVLAFGWYAAGMMIGVLLGLVVAVSLAIWQARLLWLPRPLPFDWRTVLGQVIPLMLGFGAFQFLFTGDTMFAKTYFDSDTVGFYGSAGTLSRALMWLVGPLATVMFPRIVHSEAKAEGTDLMGVVLLGTALLAVGGAVGLSVLGPWVVNIMSGGAFVKVASSVLPWYASAMVPLALANVLLNNLLARSRFSVVPPLCILAVAYAWALTRFHDTLVMLLKTLGCFNLMLLAVCAWFTWRGKKQ